jgi:hypothetical protein
MRCYWGNEIKEDEMGGACTTRGKNEKIIQNFAWKTLREEASGRLRLRPEDDVKMDLREIGYKGKDGIHLAQDKGPLTDFCKHGNEP